MQIKIKILNTNYFKNKILNILNKNKSYNLII